MSNSSKEQYFGMRVTSEEKKKIKKVAAMYHTTATKVIINLVDKELTKEEQKPKRLTAKELMGLSEKERSSILRSQSKEVAADYQLEEDFDDFIDY